jgi:hypothetical protein
MNRKFNPLFSSAALGVTFSLLEPDKKKQAVKCGLNDCARTTTHNGGYCCAAHCKLDRERRKDKK